MRSHHKRPLKGPPVRNARSSFRRSHLPWFSLVVLFCTSAAQAQSQSPDQPQTEQPAPAVVAAASPAQSPSPQPSGTISGIVVDPAGDFVAGARVTLARDDRSPAQQALSGAEGQFFFAAVAPGLFQLIIAADGFATKTFSATLQPGDALTVPQIALAVAAEVTEVPVVMSRVEVAEAEIKEEEKQRVLGFIPNFYVSYVPDARPLTTKQKFELAGKTMIDPISFGIVAFIAGAQQASNSFSGYGQGGQGYGKRFGAGMADSFTSTFLGAAILPSLLRQDPRYFYKGTGGKRSRILYAIATAVICKSDKGHWQANYSGILGAVASGGISNLYYPASDRGAGLVFENTGIGIGASAIGNLFQEFLVKKLTPHLPKRDPAKH